MTSPPPDTSFLTLVSGWMTQGGPVMWPLLLCSMVAVGVIIERALTFFISSRQSAKGMPEIEKAYQSLEEGRIGEAIQRLRAAGPVGEFLAVALSSKSMPLEDALEIAGGELLANLRRRLPLLDTLITLTPMLGILGTVTGIISSFHLLDLAGGTDPSAISSGIAEALITTATGLSIAIVVLLPFNAFKTRLGEWSKRIDREARRCITAYEKGRGNAV